MIGSSPFVLATFPGLPAKNVAGAARARQGASRRNYTYGSAGPATLAHLSGALLEKLGKVELTHVPYRGTAQSTLDLIGGRVDMQFGTIPPSLANIREGKIRALAVTGETRNATLPDVPTIAESGLTGYEASLWQAIRRTRRRRRRPSSRGSTARSPRRSTTPTSRRRSTSKASSPSPARRKRSASVSATISRNGAMSSRAPAFTSDDADGSLDLAHDHQRATLRARAGLRTARHGGGGPFRRDARRHFGAQARRQHHRRHGGGIGGADGDGRPGDLDRRRLLPAVSRGQDRPHGRPQRVGHRAAGRNAGAFCRRHEDAWPAGAGGAGAGARLGRHASPLRHAAVARACSTTPSRSPKAIRYRIRSPSDSHPRSTASRPIPAARRSTCRTDARSPSATCCASRRWPRPCARSPTMAPTLSIAAPIGAAHRRLLRRMRRADPRVRSRGLRAALGRAGDQRLSRPSGRGDAAEFARRPVADAVERALRDRRRDA